MVTNPTRTNPSYSIEVKNLIVEYSSRRIVNDLSFSVRQGEIFGFLGPNGAGKSTTIKAILGLVPPKSGQISIGGISAEKPQAREKVGYLPEDANYPRFLTPAEILSYYGNLFGIPPAILKSRVDELLALVGLSAVKNKLIGTFSKGMSQKVSLAQALINNPDTLILDEPTTGLDPLAKLALRKIITDLKKRGKTVFFSSHELSEVELLCDSLVILKNGSILRQGTLSEVLRNQEKNLERFFLDTIQGAAS